MSKVNVPMNLPQIITASDYHEFYDIQTTFAKFGANVNYQEFPTERAPYAAIFFLNEYNELCKEMVVTFKNDV